MANESENTSNFEERKEKAMDMLNDVAEKAKCEMKLLRNKTIVLWAMFIAALCALGTYCFHISPHVTEKNVKFQGSCIATSDSSMSHCASAQASANSVNPSTKHEDPSSKFNASRRAEVNGCASCRTSSFKFSLFLAIGGFALLFVVICGSLISTDRDYKELLKLYVTARRRQDVWAEGLKLLDKSKGIVNQHWELNCCNCCTTNSPAAQKGHCAAQPPTVTFGNNCTWNGDSNMGQPCKSGNGDGGIGRKSNPVLHADYKVIETLLENLSDDPSKRMFM